MRVAESLWRVAQAVSVTVAVAVVLLLIAKPDVGLFVTWKLLVPIVPAVLILAPQVWRNLCPIAVVHQVPAALGRAGSRRLSPTARRAAPIVAGLLFLILVPLRLLLLNEHGAALAIFVLLVLGVALAGGFLVGGKAGWCATWCPVLPVERLYGQDPVITTKHAHCTSCTACVRACYDLTGGRSMESLLGGTLRARHPEQSVLRTPMGAFAAGLPGFILAYFTHPAALGAIATYARIMAFVLAALAAVAVVQRIARVSPRTFVRASAALSLALYYWFTVADVAAAAHTMLAIPEAPAGGIMMARLSFVLLAGGWWLGSSEPGRRMRLLANGRALPIILVSSAALVGLGWMSRAPYSPPSEAGAALRLSWRLRGERERTCRPRTQAELDALPAHMRTAEVCEEVLISYRLTVTIDDAHADTAHIAPGGLRADRPLFVLRELPVTPGRHRVRVDFARQGGDAPAEKRLSLDAEVRLRPGDVALVTTSPDGTRLVLREPVAR